MLPDYLQQGLGLPPVDDTLAGDPYGGLHPAVAQQLGFAPVPPPVEQPAADLPPLQLPSAQQPVVPPQPAPSKDFRVPVSAIDGPGTPAPVAPAKPAAAPRPMTPEQGFAAAQAQRQAAEQNAEAAVQQQAQAMAPKNADDLAAAQAHKDQADAIAAQQKAWSDEHDKALAKSQAQIAADNQALDSYKVDQGKYWREAGVGNHVGWYIAMALSNFGDALQKKSGPNPIVQMLQDKMHQSVVEQVDARDALKEKRGRDVQTQAEAEQGFASRNAEILRRDGANDRAFANAVALAAAKSADPMQQAQAAKIIADLRIQSADKQEAAVKDQAAYSVQKQQIAISGGQLAESKRHNLVEEGWQQTKFNEEQNMKAAALMAKQQGKLTDEESKRAVYGVGPDGRREPLRNKDGSVVLEGDPTLADKKNRMIAAATAYNRLTNQMRRAIADHGGSSTWIKGSDWQDMVSDLQSATAELHDAYGITAFREPTVQFFEKMASAGVDPTSFVRDASSALKHSNTNLQSKVNEMITGYDGPPITWQDTSKPGEPVKTTEDEKLADALSNPRRAYDDRTGRLVNELGKPADTETLSGLLEKQGNILPSVRQNIQTWGAMLDSGDPATSGHARAILENIVEKSESPEQAALAKQLLARNMATSAFRGGEPEQIRGSAGIRVPIGGNP